MEELKREYNQTIQRINKAHEYFNDNPNKCEGKLLEEYQKLLARCSELDKHYKELTGEYMSKENLLNGFE